MDKDGTAKSAAQLGLDMTGSTPKNKKDVNVHVKIGKNLEDNAERAANPMLKNSKDGVDIKVEVADQELEHQDKESVESKRKTTGSTPEVTQDGVNVKVEIGNDQYVHKEGELRRTGEKQKDEAEEGFTKTTMTTVTDGQIRQVVEETGKDSKDQRTEGEDEKVKEGRKDKPSRQKKKEDSENRKGHPTSEEEEEEEEEVREAKRERWIRKLEDAEKLRNTEKGEKQRKAEEGEKEESETSRTNLIAKLDKRVKELEIAREETTKKVEAAGSHSKGSEKEKLDKIVEALENVTKELADQKAAVAKAKKAREEDEPAKVGVANEVGKTGKESVTETQKERPRYTEDLSERKAGKRRLINTEDRLEEEPTERVTHRRRAPEETAFLEPQQVKQNQLGHRLGVTPQGVVYSQEPPIEYGKTERGDRHLRGHAADKRFDHYKQQAEERRSVEESDESTAESAAGQGKHGRDKKAVKNVHPVTSANASQGHHPSRKGSDIGKEAVPSQKTDAEPDGPANPDDMPTDGSLLPIGMYLTCGSGIVSLMPRQRLRLSRQNPPLCPQPDSGKTFRKRAPAR